METADGEVNISYFDKPEDNDLQRPAVAFSYFEKLIESANQAMFHSEVARITFLNNLLTTAGFEELLCEDIIEETTTLLKNLSKISESCESLEHSKKLLLQHFNNNEISDSIVYHLRLLASAWLKTNSEKYEAFLPGGMSVEAYSKDFIEPVNQEIDHLGMQLLIDVLLEPIPFRVEIVYLDRSEGSHANTYIFQPEDFNGVPIDPGSPIMHLLYRPSHYDILYKDSISTPVCLNNGVPQDVNTQINRITGFRERKYLSFEGSELSNSARLSLVPDQVFDVLSCIPGFQLPPQQNADQSKFKGKHT
jgi:ubiquitin thioesterase protein OTUB1